MLKLRKLMFVLPNLFTVSSIFCGFYALTLCAGEASPSHLYQAALAIFFASSFRGKGNGDMRRRAFEQMPPAEYLATSYYEHWLWGLEKLLVDNGILAREEIAARPPLRVRRHPTFPPLTDLIAPSGRRYRHLMTASSA